MLTMLLSFWVIASLSTLYVGQRDTNGVMALARSFVLRGFRQWLLQVASAVTEGSICETRHCKSAAHLQHK